MTQRGANRYYAKALSSEHTYAWTSFVTQKSLKHRALLRNIPWSSTARERSSWKVLLDSMKSSKRKFNDSVTKNSGVLSAREYEFRDYCVNFICIFFLILLHFPFVYNKSNRHLICTSLFLLLYFKYVYSHFVTIEYYTPLLYFAKYNSVCGLVPKALNKWRFNKKYNIRRL